MKHSDIMLANHSQYLTNDKLYWYLFSWENTSRNNLVSTKKKVAFQTVRCQIIQTKFEIPKLLKTMLEANSWNIFSVGVSIQN